jgi:16S rRNA G1207 methylase RsmC
MIPSLNEIKRYPLRKDDLLQGHDAADELLLQHLGTLDLRNKRILIINDHFGALSCHLQSFDCTTLTDSYVSKMAIELNSKGKIHPIHLLKDITGKFDIVLIQLPKNMSYFEDLLCTLTPHLHAGSLLICTSMIKHMAPMSFELLHKYIGATTTSLAQKKARLIFSRFERSVVESPYPQLVKLDGFEKAFINHSNLFSRDKLDIGTRFFLEHLPVGITGTILDLGCANGIIGIKAKTLNPDAHIIFSDESSMAIESAKANYQSYFSHEAEYKWLNCFEGQAPNSLDYVLCNPPFHQNNTVGDFIAWQMFKDSFESLKPRGVIRVIGNSHLGYQIKLKKIFGHSKIIATNKKFIICESFKT